MYGRRDMIRITLAITVLVVGMASSASAEIHKSVRRLYERGVESNKQDRYAEAITYYSMAIAQDPSSAELYFVRGRAYLQDNQVDNSIRDLDTAIRLKPEMAEAYNQRGIAYVSKEMWGNAQTNFETACSLGLDAGCINAKKLKRALKREVKPTP
jgi:lipoprotein NlpI